ncbi:MAG TPA: hypothetical protein VHZ97_08305 [Pseudonocardiaceae bacterium]|nr:hypothetical protein [Pseudonocardiaceae bacterium]
MSDVDIHERLHQAMHRLPGVPSHDEAEERNGKRAGRARVATMNEAGRARAKRWSTSLNEGSQAQTDRRHAKPPRVLVGVQEFIARLVGHGQ